MKHLLILICLMLSGPAAGTSVPPKPLAEMVEEADCIVAATVEQVSMVNGRGRPVADRNAKTGPGLKNQIRFHLEVEDVLRSKGAALPSRIVVPLWTMWHYELGAITDAAQGSTGIFLLKCGSFEPVYPAGFQRPLSEREEIERLMGATAVEVPVSGSDRNAGENPSPSVGRRPAR